jgi:hypothetical protein
MICLQHNSRFRPDGRIGDPREKEGSVTRFPVARRKQPSSLRTSAEELMRATLEEVSGCKRVA